MVDEKHRILVVDDEKNVRESLKLILSRKYEVEVAGSGEEAVALLNASSQEARPDIILLDLVMPGMDGLAFLNQIQDSRNSSQVIMLTATNSVRTAVQAMKKGVVDYLNKPFDVDELLSLIAETIETGAQGRVSPSTVQIAQHDRHGLPEGKGDFGALVGSHRSMVDLYQKIAKVAPRETTTLITGESGTGKELIAREIHRRSSRSEGPFVALNCAAIPESLIESELFGHEKGAFTHAIEQRAGQFELAEGGTLFLDEIGELSPSVQVKMLRVLQEREYMRVGSSEVQKSDVRILAATNRSLQQAIESGSFRQDLYYRINVVGIEAPALRNRGEDLKQLVEFFLVRLAPLYGGRKLIISEEAMKEMLSYSWPGNVRELENVVESVLALCSKDLVEVSDLPSRVVGAKFSGSQEELDLKQRVIEGLVPFEEAERVFETELILKALQKTSYVQTKAAKLLGISRRILKYKMDKLGISSESH